MNGIVHGMDVSGLMHFPHTPQSRETAHRPSPVSSFQPDRTPSSPENSRLRKLSSSSESHPHRPILHRTSSSPTLTNGTSSPSASSTSIPSPSRRPSWLTNISSKFSSNSPDVGEVNGATAGAQSNGVADSPKNGHTSQPGFLLATLRRLSATSTSARDAFGKKAPTVGQCPRMVLNRDENRERCGIPELDENKLRKVAFCVDVEVAPSPEDVEARREARRKRREAREKEKEKLKQLGEDGKPVDPAPGGGATTDVLSSNPSVAGKPTADKMDKKERKEERKEKKERKTAAEASNNADTSSNTPQPESKPSPSPTEGEEQKQSGSPQLNGVETEEKQKNKRRVHARPTTDPVKIYTQCSQLRETQMVPRVKEELLKAGGAAILQQVDLTGYKFNLPDAVAFSDFLALVPTKQLLLQECDLTDEMVRVVLAALGAVKSPNQLATTKKLSKDDDEGRTTPPTLKLAHEKQHYERGTIERLSLRGNTRISSHGWRYISCFVHMSRSLKALDVSGIPLPSRNTHHRLGIRSSSPPGKAPLDITQIFSKALGHRLIGHGLEELDMGNCNMSYEQLKCVMVGVTSGGTTRLGLEGNSITDDGLALIGRWMKGSGDSKRCEALDLSNNDVHDHAEILSASINELSPLCALKLSNCNLTASSLSSLLPALAQLQGFRWLLLSDNPQLFSSQPDALPLFRKFLPRMKGLRKLDLSNTSMTVDHAIALTEILPECPSMAYVKFSGNHIPLGQTVMDEGLLEEGAALYTALVVAVKVSKTIVRVDMDEPGPQAGEIIHRLSKRLLAHCLKNMEAGAVEEDWSVNTPAVSREASELKSMVSTSPKDTTPTSPSQREPLEDDDDIPHPAYEYDEEGVWREEDTFVVGGTGVVKALGVCLGNKPAASSRASSIAGPLLLQRSDTLTSLGDDENAAPQDRANEMSKALLMRARNIKERIQPALRKSYSGETPEYHHRRLLFLDETLHHVIQRFEEEYPECRRALPTILEPPLTSSSPPPMEPESTPNPDREESEEPLDTSLTTTQIARPISRRSSDVSLHSRNLQNEEAQMHKLANYMRSKMGDEDEEDGDVVIVDGEETDEESRDGEELRRAVLQQEGGVEGYIGRLEDEKKNKRLSREVAFSGMKRGEGCK